MKLTKGEKEDYRRYYIDNPGSGFNPDKCRAVVNDCIEKYELERKLRSDKYTEQLRERVDASVSYILHSGQKSTPLEKYFTRQYLAYLQGQRIVQKLKRLANGKQIITLEEVT